MPNNLTDNKIKKALECCMKGYCDDCPFRKTREHCLSIDGLLLDLINRQDEEINRLQAENERLSRITRNLVGEIKAEAYTEFAEELKKRITGLGFWQEYECVFTIVLDDLLKEKVGSNEKS